MPNDHHSEVIGHMGETIAAREASIAELEEMVTQLQSERQDLYIVLAEITQLCDRLDSGYIFHATDLREILKKAR